MNRKENARAGMLAGLQAGHEQARLDARLAVNAGAVAMMPLEAVKDRAGEDTRQPTQEALAALAESINALGLLEPLVIDNRGRLLAGKHRLLAVRALADKDPGRWEKVPVRRMDFDAATDPARALAVEVAENEQRRDYTAAEVRELAARLTSAGFRAKPGRPRKGEKALLPALGAVVGLHKRQLIRILDPDMEKKTVTFDTFFDTCARLSRALAAFNKAADDTALADMTPAQRRAVKAAGELADMLNKA